MWLQCKGSGVGPGLECVDLSGELELNDLSMVVGGQDVSVTQCQAA